MSERVVLILFLALVMGGGLVIGSLFPPGAWYAGLAKPAFNPPNWIFGPVWTALYVAIAVAGWRVWRHEPRSRAMTIWWTQLALNFTWTPVFFGARQIGLALVVIVLLLAAVLAFIRATWLRERPAALLFLPYAAWVAFATLLNAAILALN